MSLQEQIEHKLQDAFAPSHLEVDNESHMHHVPEGSESHFRVVVVSEAFEGEKRVARQRAVNKVLADELAGGVHALAMHAMTPAEWAGQDDNSLASPRCAGGFGR